MIQTEIALQGGTTLHSKCERAIRGTELPLNSILAGVPLRTHSHLHVAGTHTVQHAYSRMQEKQTSFFGPLTVKDAPKPVFLPCIKSPTSNKKVPHLKRCGSFFRRFWRGYGGLFKGTSCVKTHIDVKRKWELGLRLEVIEAFLGGKKCEKWQPT